MNEDCFLKLRSLVAAFHTAVEKIDFTDSGLNLANFPTECCHHACKLLGIFLYEQGIKELQIFSGSRPDDPDGEHLWLEVESVVVDITAYQFAGVTEKVIVTRNSAWHSALNGKVNPLGLENEAAEEYFQRIRDFYNNRFDKLYDRIHAVVQGLLLE